MAKSMARYLATVALGQPVLKFNDLFSEMAHQKLETVGDPDKPGRCQNFRLPNCKN